MAERGSSTKKEKWWWTGLLLPVVAGILVEIFTSVEVFSTLWGWVKAMGSFFASPITIPLWAGLLLPFVGAGVVIGWKALARRRNRSAEDEYRAYTSARILDVDWDWVWLGGRLRHLTIRCPECSNQLDLEDDPAGYAYGVMGASVPCMVKCKHCGFKKQFNTTVKEVVETVCYEIPRRFRTGEYKIKKRLGSKSEDV